MGFVVSCFLVVDRKIIAFEQYRPFAGIIWGKGVNLDHFIRSNKSVVADLHRYTCVSYRYFEGVKWEFKISDRHDHNKVC